MSAESVFASRFGPWALVAGASEGLGAAFAIEAARRGLDVVLVARRKEALEGVASEIRSLGRKALPIVCDLADADASERIGLQVGAREVGLLILNAAFAPRGPYMDSPIERWLTVVDVNIRAPLRLAHAFAGPMRTRRRGGLVFLSSMASFQGAATLATYSASKAFARIFAESLWAEMREDGVDVLAACAGATSTPGFLQEARFIQGAQSPDAVVAETFDALGGGPVLVSGRTNRAARALLAGLPSAWRVRLMSLATQKTLKPQK